MVTMRMVTSVAYDAWYTAWRTIRSAACVYINHSTPVTGSHTNRRNPRLHGLASHRPIKPAHPAPTPGTPETEPRGAEAHQDDDVLLPVVVHVSLESGEVPELLFVVREILLPVHVVDVRVLDVLEETGRSLGRGWSQP